MAEWESCVAVYCGASPGKKPVYEQAAVGKYDRMVGLYGLWYGRGMMFNSHNINP